MGDVAKNTDVVNSDNYIPVTEKAAANGVATLDLGGKVPSTQLPSLDYIPTSQKAAANGVASLNSSGKVPDEQLPLVQFVAKGDLLTFDGTDAVRKPAGITDGMVLTRRSTSPDGLSWELPLTQLNDEGSIFSMKGPLGAADALVTYNFTRFDPDLTVAQNLTATNLSLNFALDLISVGTPVYDFAAKQTLLGPRPKNALSQGGALVTTDTVPDMVSTNLTTDNTIRLIGEMTAEILLTVLAISSTAGQEAVLFAMMNTGEAEDNNQIYVLKIVASAGPVFTLAYFAEHNAGVNITANLCTIPNPVGAGPLYLALTRTAQGRVTVYVNGARASALITPTDEGGGGVIIPTRGSNPTQNLKIGGSTLQGFKGLWYGMKISGECFSDAQINESYNRSMYGVGQSLV